MTVISAAGFPAPSGPWRWPVDAGRYDTAPLLRAAKHDVITELGAGNADGCRAASERGARPGGPGRHSPHL